MEWSCLACGAVCPDAHQFCGHCGAKRTARSGAGGEVDDVLRALVGEQLRAELVEHGGRLPEERRLVSALFADLSGFTALAGRLDPEALTMVVDPILAGLVRIVKRGEGHVGAFAGDALLCYFGAPVAHEDDAVRAVRCAREMLEEFPALLAAVPPEAGDLSLRIGVDTGAVMARLVAGDIRTDYNVLGNAVNMAQRLQSNAPPGGLVVGETTYRLTRDHYDYEDVGPLQVKGRSEPLPAFLLRSEKTSTVQRRAARTERLHGRTRELATLDRAQAAGPARGLLLVADAGTGKSRLLEEARVRSPRPWHEGGCVPHDARAYRPWIGVLDSLDAPNTSDGIRLVRGADLDEELESLPPAVRRDRVARDVAGLLRTAAPAVVVLEDLHWADRPTLDLLDDLLFELGDADVLLLASSREKPDTAADLELLELAPLDREAVAELLADLLGGPAPEELVADVVRRSGGNPLYVTELAFVLRDRGLVRLVDGDVLATTAAGLDSALDLVPDTVEGLIGARIDALPAAQERALTIAAALGPPVDATLITAMTAELAEPGAAMSAALAGLREARLLDDQGDFVHALVQHTAYVRTPRARRRQLHLAAAAVGPALVPDDRLPGYLARHLYLAGAGDRAIAALEHAAEDALARDAHDEALLHLYREIELRRSDAAGEGRRAALLHRLVVCGEQLELLGRYEEAEPHFREALDLGAGAVAYRGLVGCLRRLGQYQEVVRLADEAAAVTDDLRLRAETGWEKAGALAALGRFEEAMACLEPSPDPAFTARQDLVRAYCLLSLEGPESALGLLERAVVVLDDAGDLARYAHGQRLLGWVYAASGLHREAVGALHEGMRAARRCGAAEEVLHCLNHFSMVPAEVVGAELALSYAREAVTQSDRMRHAFGRAVTRNNLAQKLIDLGRPAEAVSAATSAVELARDNALGGVLGSFLETRGVARLRSGDVEGASRDAEESLSLVLGTEDEPATRALLEAIAARGTETAPVPKDGAVS